MGQALRRQGDLFAFAAREVRQCVTSTGPAAAGKAVAGEGKAELQGGLEAGERGAQPVGGVGGGSAGA